jgi:hypothetical protein
MPGNKEYQKKYYESKKQTILDEGKTKQRCETCNCDVAKWHLSRHNKTKKHLKRILIIPEPNNNDILNAPTHAEE